MQISDRERVNPLLVSAAFATFAITRSESSAADKKDVSIDDMPATAKLVRWQSDSISVAEPEIHIENANHIGIRLVELTSANESKFPLGSAQGSPVVLIAKYTHDKRQSV